MGRLVISLWNWNIKLFGHSNGNFDSKASTEKRMLQLTELEEMRLNAYNSSRLYKERVKVYHDRKLLKREFKTGQLVLLFNSRLRLFPGKLSPYGQDHLWLSKLDHMELWK